MVYFLFQAVYGMESPFWQVFVNSHYRNNSKVFDGSDDCSVHNNGPNDCGDDDNQHHSILLQSLIFFRILPSLIDCY